MTEISKAFLQAYGITVESVFGGSGTLAERLAGGEAADVFASADMGNPQRLTTAGKAGPTVLFARNHFCAILRPGLNSTPATLLATLLDPSVKLATSTPKIDPGGDYAWAMFQKADAEHPGARVTLEAKALKIGNVPGSLAIPPTAGNAVAWLFGEKRADVFLSYCTGGSAVTADLPGATVMPLPPSLAITADYGLTILKGSNKDEAAKLVMFILSPAGQKILSDHGFDAPLMP